MTKMQDFECLDCEEVFEAWDDEANCPDCGGRNLEVVFITPRGTASVRTQNADAVVKDLIQTTGRTDFNNNPNTTHTPTQQNSFANFSAKNKAEFDRNINAAVTAKMQGTLQSLGSNGTWRPTGQIKPISDMRDVPTAGDTIRQLKRNRQNQLRPPTNVIASVDNDGRVKRPKK